MSKFNVYKRIKIRKGSRRPFLDFLRNCIVKFHDCNNKITIGYSYEFNESCKYYHNPKDQYDWNKLFGVSLKMNPHHTSFRWAWRYNDILGVFQVAPYLYNNGKQIQPISSLIYNVNKDYKFFVEIFYDNVTGYVCMKYNGERELVYLFEGMGDLKKLYRCGLYFGGNKKAPHTIVIKRMEY